MRQLTIDVPVADRADVYRRVVDNVSAKDSGVTVSSSTARKIDGYPAMFVDETIQGEHTQQIVMYCADDLTMAFASGSAISSGFLDTLHADPPGAKACDWLGSVTNACVIDRT